MELFEGDNYAGQCVELCDDCPFLQAQGLTKNCVNSIKVYGDGAYVSERRGSGCLSSAAQEAGLNVKQGFSFLYLIDGL